MQVLQNSTVRALLGATLLAALSVLESSADSTSRSAPRTIPIQGTFGTTFELSATDSPGVLRNVAAGVGRVPALGVCTLSVEETADFTVNPPAAVGDWVLTFSDGATLYVHTSGVGTPDSADPAFVHLDGIGEVTGGTGRFAEARGKLKLSGVLHIETPPDAPTASGHASVEIAGLVRLGRG